MRNQRVAVVASFLVVWLVTALWQERTRLCDDALAGRQKVAGEAPPGHPGIRRWDVNVQRYCLTWLGLP